MEMKATNHELPLPARSTDRAGSTTLLVVDDHQAVRLGLQELLEHEPGIGIVYSAASCGEALAMAELAAAEGVAPDIAVVDFHLPDRDGLTLTQQLKALADPPRVLVFSAYADERLELAALISGADGVLGKSSLGVELCYRIHSLARGAGSQFSISGETLAAASFDLDIKDRPILGMLANGTPPGEIATVLGVSEQWLDIRRWAILQRLKAPPRDRRSEKAATGGRWT
jgi:DNA-binding NarL/FixJ family response regulator